MKDAPETRHSLLARLHGSDNDGAWTEFVTLYEPAIYRFARRQGLQDADAREIVQEVLLNVRSLALKPLSNKMERFRAWLATVTRNRVIDLVRKKARKERPLGHLQDWSINNNDEGLSYEIRHQMFVIASQRVQRQSSVTQWQAFWQTAVEMAPAHEAGKTFLVMPLIANGSLQHRIDQDGPLSLEDTLRIGLQIAEALAAAHASGVIHRDVKPANILLEDGNKRVVLSDFGLARTLDDASITASGLIAGTPAYMSPEQARGESVDSRTDLYSLGSVLYAMCTGHSPFQASSTLKLLREVSNAPFRSVHRYQEQLPIWLDKMIARFTASDPNQRVANATQGAELLRSCLFHVTNPNQPLPRELTSDKHRLATYRWSILVCTAVVLSGILGTIAYFSSSNPRFVTTPGNESAIENNASLSRPLETTQVWTDPLELEIQKISSDLTSFLERAQLVQSSYSSSSNGE